MIKQKRFLSFNLFMRDNKICARTIYSLFSLSFLPLIFLSLFFTLSCLLVFCLTRSCFFIFLLFISLSLFDCFAGFLNVRYKLVYCLWLCYKARVGKMNSIELKNKVYLMTTRISIRIRSIVLKNVFKEMRSAIQPFTQSNMTCQP